MSNSSISRGAAVLVGFSIFMVSVSPIMAQGGLPATRPILKSTAERSATSGAINKSQLLQQKITIKNIEDNIANMREKLASKAALLKTKLQTFKDQKKADIAERVNTNLNQINQNQTTQMQKYLDTMSSILDKLEARVNQPTPDIKDPVGAKTAIASARSVIATSSAAVAAQAQKDYTIAVTTESKIRVDAKAMRDKLHTDILAIRKDVVDAKQAVSHAIRIAKSGSTITTRTKAGSPKTKTTTGIEKEGTTSGQQ